MRRSLPTCFLQVVTHACSRLTFSLTKFHQNGSVFARCRGVAVSMHGNYVDLVGGGGDKEGWIWR